MGVFQHRFHVDRICELDAPDEGDSVTWDVTGPRVTRPSTETSSSTASKSSRVSLTTCTSPARGSTIGSPGRHASRTAA